MVEELIGYLTEDSFVREFFPDGKVPLKSPFATDGRGRAEDGDEHITVYEVDLEKVSPEALEKILTWFEGKGFTGDFTRQEIRRYLMEEGFRIQKKHFSSVPIDMRLFI